MSLEQFALRDKVAIVTGSSRGIGKAMALGFARAGADLVVLSRHLPQAEEVAKEIHSLGRKALALKVDVSKKEEIDYLVEKTLEEFDKIDILVNNAGISPFPKRAEEVSEEEWDQTMKINLKGIFLCSQAVGKVMIEQKKGKIINMSSVLGSTVRTGLMVYCVGKAGIIQLTKALAVEWAKYNINVNALAPGWIETELIEDLESKEKIYKSYLEAIPLRRFGQPEEVVGAAIFLASEASNYLTGTTLFIDGGWTAL